MLEPALIPFINRLLSQEDWARERLAPFAGRTAALHAVPLPALRFTVREDGLLAAEATQKAIDATIVLRPGALEVTGEQDFAELLRLLANNLRWDVEEELSRFVGDIAARRIAQGAKDFVAWQRDTAARLGDSFGRYLVDEARLLAPRSELDELAEAMAGLHERLERLEKRLASLA